MSLGWAGSLRNNPDRFAFRKKGAADESACACILKAACPRLPLGGQSVAVTCAHVSALMFLAGMGKAYRLHRWPIIAKPVIEALCGNCLGDDVVN